MRNTVKKNDGQLESYPESASIRSGIEVTEELLEKINKFTVNPVEKDNVVVYPVLLIDDKVTRNNTQYPKEFQKTLLSLPVGEGNVIGASLLLGTEKDHQNSASAQLGRIFDASQVTDKEGNYGILGHVYMLKEGNEETINKIDSGILKEVSISTKVEMPICSICHQDIRECEHDRGKDGCYISMSGKGFCAEVSLVATPGSTSAKILNKDKVAEYKTVNEAILNERFTLIEERLEKLVNQIPSTLENAFKEFGSNLIPPSGLPTKSEEEWKDELNENRTNSDLLNESLKKLELGNNDLLRQIEELKSKVKESEEYISKEKESLIEETLRLGTLCESIKFENKEDARKLFENMNLEQVKKTKDSFFAESKKMYPEIYEIEEPKEEKKKIKAIHSTVNVMDFKNK